MARVARLPYTLASNFNGILQLDLDHDGDAYRHISRFFWWPTFDYIWPRQVHHFRDNITLWFSLGFTCYLMFMEV